MGLLLGSAPEPVEIGLQPAVELECDPARGKEADPFRDPTRLINPFEALEAANRLFGTASFYSAFFDGRRTASGEIYRSSGFSAAHLTLPMGCLLEVEALATGLKVKVRMNDRGPYSGGFVVDLSQAALRRSAWREPPTAG